jgi:hypothetical protein
MAGSLQVNISDLLLGADGIGANISMVADNLRRDGLALMDGAMSLGLDLMMSEEETETETHWVTTSLTDLLVNLDITGLATMGQLLSGTIAVDGEIQSIVHTAFETYEETEETMGDLTVTIGNFNSGEIDVTSGTIRLVLQMPGTTALYADMETSDGPVSLEMDIYQSPDGAETLIDTIGVAEVMGYSLQITGLSFQPLQCEDYPVAGTIVIGRAGMEYVITITGDCAGGFTIEKR